MDKLSDWFKTRENFSNEEALIGSRYRSDESARSNNFIEAANCLRALGYQKDKTQTRINGSRKYLWRKI